ncbi:MAG: hypothetical protein JST36_00840 [Bacteroidetes bacterium]|nr:hypothetical protein [Bacteroidota bacterium]
MKRILSAIVVIWVISGCNNESKQYSATEIQAKVDSIVGSRLPEINRKAMEDLDLRMAIEVKAKADSILQVRQAQAPKPIANTTLPATDSLPLDSLHPLHE